jgi:hypothetical protein
MAFIAARGMPVPAIRQRHRSRESVADATGGAEILARSAGVRHRAAFGGLWHGFTAAVVARASHPARQ